MNVPTNFLGTPGQDSKIWDNPVYTGRLATLVSTQGVVLLQNALKSKIFRGGENKRDANVQ
jgi:hypothetical protein